VLNWENNETHLVKAKAVMTVLEPVHCRNYNGTNVVKHGKSDAGKQRYCCRDSNCQRHCFILEFTARGYLPEVKQQVSEMASNGSRITDTG